MLAWFHLPPRPLRLLSRFFPPSRPLWCATLSLRSASLHGPLSCLASTLPLSLPLSLPPPRARQRPSPRCRPRPPPLPARLPACPSRHWQCSPPSLRGTLIRCCWTTSTPQLRTPPSPLPTLCSIPPPLHACLSPSPSSLPWPVPSLLCRVVAVRIRPFLSTVPPRAV